MTDLIRSAVFEKIEDAHDLAELREALTNSDMNYYTHDDVKKELVLFVKLIGERNVKINEDVF